MGSSGRGGGWPREDEAARNLLGTPGDSLGFGWAAGGPRGGTSGESSASAAVSNRVAHAYLDWRRATAAHSRRRPILWKRELGAYLSLPSARNSHHPTASTNLSPPAPPQVSQAAGQVSSRRIRRARAGQRDPVLGVAQAPVLAVASRAVVRDLAGSP